MTRYLGVIPLQEPGEVLGLDENKRPQWSFNVQILKRPSATLASELEAIVRAPMPAGVVVISSLKATIPPTGSVVSVIVTGGAAPLGTMNDGVGAYRRPNAQIIARAATAQDAETLAQLAYSALVDVVNREVSA